MNGSVRPITTFVTSLLAASLAACSATQDLEAVAAETEAYELGVEEGRREAWQDLNGGLTEHKRWREPLLVRIPVPERRRGAVVIGPSDQVVVVRSGGWKERAPGPGDAAPRP